MTSRSRSWRPARWESCGKVWKVLSPIVIVTSINREEKTGTQSRRRSTLKEVIRNNSLILGPDILSQCKKPFPGDEASVDIIHFCSQRLFQKRVSLVLSLISKQVGCWLPSKQSYKRWQKWGRAFVCAHSPFRSSSHHALRLKPSTELTVALVRPTRSKCG